MKPTHKLLVQLTHSYYPVSVLKNIPDKPVEVLAATCGNYFLIHASNNPHLKFKSVPYNYIYSDTPGVQVIMQKEINQ